MNFDRTLADRLDSDAEAWRPEPGDRVIGTVIDVDSRTSEFGTYPIVVIETDDGNEISIHGFHTVLKNEFARRPPQPGERIGVKYLGKNAKGGYEAYRVVFDKVTPPDWAAIGAEAQAEAAVAGIGSQEPDPEGVPF
jgi:hypothetical protein